MDLVGNQELHLPVESQVKEIFQHLVKCSLLSEQELASVMSHDKDSLASGVLSAAVEAMLGVLKNSDPGIAKQKSDAIEQFEKCKGLFIARSRYSQLSDGQFSEAVSCEGFDIRARDAALIRKSLKTGETCKRSVERLSLACKAFLEINAPVSDAKVSQASVFNYFANQLPLAHRELERDAEEVQGRYYVIRRAYSESGHVNISTINIRHHNEALVFDSSRTDSDGSLRYDISGFLLRNSERSFTLFGTANNSGKKNKNAFTESISLRYRRTTDQRWNGVHHGLYNGLCGDNQTPYSTRVIVVEVPEGAPDISLAMPCNKFSSKNKKLSFLKQTQCPADGVLDILDCSIDSHFGGLRHYHRAKV